MYTFNFVPGQHPSSHGWISLLGPTHFSPPLAGRGLLHSRERMRFPIPHVTLHFPNFQGPQEPFTVNVQAYIHCLCLYLAYKCGYTYIHVHSHYQKLLHVFPTFTRYYLSGVDYNTIIVKHRPIPVSCCSSTIHKNKVVNIICEK